MRSKNFPKTSLLFILFTLLGITFFSLKTPQLPFTISPKKARPDFWFEGVSISQIRKGKREWVLHAKTATLSRRLGVSTLSEVNGQVFQNKKSTLTFHSPTATLTSQSSQLTLGPTQATFQIPNYPVEILCQTMIWDEKKHTITGQGNVRVSQEGVHLYGNIFEADLRTQKVRIYDNAYAELEAQ